jgi:hypothetical protein
LAAEHEGGNAKGEREGHQLTEFLVQHFLLNYSSTVKDCASVSGSVLCFSELFDPQLFITSHVLDGNCLKNKLLEMFSTLRGRGGVEDGSSCRPPFSWLKLTSRTMMLLDETNSSVREPDNKLDDTK